MNDRAYFRFYEELNDYLPSGLRKKTFTLSLEAPVTVREAIQSLGVPPNEVDLVLVNGQSVSFDHRLHTNDRVSVYPIFESLDITGVTRLREKPLVKLKSRSRFPCGDIQDDQEKN